MSEQNSEIQYLVRGAMLVCNKGSHPRRLNLPKSHGLYVLDKPLINENDCGEDNISYFGVCSSETPPKGAETVNLIAYGEDADKRDAKKVQGLKCCPDIVGKWSDVHGQTVTTNSCLVCACGGLITPATSGQEYSD